MLDNLNFSRSAIVEMVQTLFITDFFFVFITENLLLIETLYVYSRQSTSH